MMPCLLQTFVTIALAGEFDLSAQAGLANLLQPAETAEMAVIDLTNTTYLDSTALGMLIRLRSKMIRQNGCGDVRLAGANAQISRVLAICNLGTVFSLYPTVQDALAAASSQKIRTARTMGIEASVV
ncbi:MAG: STAS domain-containing protein [Candidatus Acidiferrales bacterium]